MTGHPLHILSVRQFANELFPVCCSDSTLLMADSFPVLKQLQLTHLSLSRCYHIHLAALT